jgi:hypothetical protein
MPDAQMGPVNRRFVDKRRIRTQDSITLSEDANYTSIAGMKARLTALKSTTYTAAKLATMTVNDLVFALRNESADSAGIK